MFTSEAALDAARTEAHSLARRHFREGNRMSYDTAKDHANRIARRLAAKIRPCVSQDYKAFDPIEVAFLHQYKESYEFIASQVRIPFTGALLNA